MNLDLKTRGLGRVGFGRLWLSRLGSNHLRSTFTFIGSGELVLSRGAYFTWITWFYSGLALILRGVNFT